MRSLLLLLALALSFKSHAGSPVIWGNVGGTTCVYSLVTKSCIDPISNTSTFYHTANGYGSTNTKIRKFTTAVSTVGTDFTVANDATNGFSLTINKAGMYSFAYCDLALAASVLGLSKNSSQLTTGIVSITDANALIMSQSLADGTACVSWEGFLVVNDVIRPHTQGDTDGPSAARTRFHAVRTN